MTSLAADPTLIGEHLLDGERVSSDRTFHKYDPTTGAVLARVADGSVRDVDLAVRSGVRAQIGWAHTSSVERRRILLRIADLLRSYDDELSRLESTEVGVPHAPGAAAFPADYYDYYAGWVDKHVGHLVPSYPHQGLGYVTYEPVGVVAALLSWNGPLGACGLKVAAALAGGNSVVIKPSELAPLTPLRFAELCLEAGLPSGVVNVVQGGPDVGRALVAHPGIAKVTYTGGVDAGRSIMGAAGALGKRTVLELGGKSANIVFPDANLERVVTQAAAMVTAHAGQICLKPARMLIANEVYDDVERELTKTVGAVRVGAPNDPGVGMGPVITNQARTRIEEFVGEAVTSGAGALLVGGNVPEAAATGGYYVQPTVFGDVDPSSALAQTECFGPVLALQRFTSEDEAISLANGTEYGLAAYVQTGDVNRAHRVARNLNAGYVGVNGLMSVRAGAPFGGTKASGVGAEGGVEGIDEFLWRRHTEIFL